MRRLVFALVATLFVPAVVYGQAGFHTSTETSLLDIYPNYFSMSLEVSYRGDDDGDNTASFVYRKIGDEKWLNGIDMTPFRDSKVWRASLFPLEPGTAYEVVVKVDDTDRVRGGELRMAARTRALVTEAGGGPTVYVSLKGDDNGDGSRKKPFKTINRAVREVRAGGEVIVAPGIYRESVVLSGVAGSERRPVVIRSEEEQKAILDGSAGLPSGAQWRQVEGEIYSVDLDWYPNYVTVDGRRSYLYRAMDQFRADPNDAKRCFYYDEKNKKLYLKTGAGDSPAGHAVLFSTLDVGFRFDGARHAVVKGFEIRHFGEAGVSIEGNSDCNIVTGNVIHHAPQGVSIDSEWADNNAVCFNHIWDKGLGDFTWRAVKASDYPRGGINCTGGRGSSMVGNDVHDWFDCIGAGAWGRLEECHINRDVEIMFNDLYNAGDDALEPEGCHINLRIHGNRIRNVLSAISLAPIGVGPAYITYNDCSFYLLFFKMNVGGCWSMGHCYSYHNTGFPVVPNRGTGFSFSLGIPLQNKNFRNNVVAVGQHLIRSGPAGNSADYNCYFLTAGSDAAPFDWERREYGTLPEFRQATGNEAHGIFADPLIIARPSPPGIEFDDYGLFHLDQNEPLKSVIVGDQRLQAGSPCIDAGMVIRGVNEDFAGAAPDIGVYERGRERKLGMSHFEK